MQEKNIINNENSKEFAIYNLTKSLKLNPIWALLFLGD